MSEVLAIDAGTTGVRAIRVDARGRVLASAYRELRQHYPRPGWVEHDPDEIFAAAVDVLGQAARGARALVALGITNQRETTVVWDRSSGDPVHRAIVWQCRRTTEACERLRKRGLEPLVRRRTGLVLDPYFSATKIRWILDEVGARRGLAFGTVDSWLIWKLTGGRVHATDPTNASRTLLFDIERRRWDAGLARAFGVPLGMLPEVRGSTAGFGSTSILGRDLPILGVAGDQQAALFGQGCTAAGSMKNTYGTGGFLMVNTGGRRRDAGGGLLGTLACGPRGEAVYALEGAVFIAGAAIQCLRDGLGLIRAAGESEALARSVRSTGGVVFVPALTGLGAPYWRPDVRGAVFGITRGTGRAELVRAALEAIAYQTRDMIEAGGIRVRELKVDGGAVANDWLMQFQADVLGARLLRPEVLDATALGAAYLAGIGAGLWRSRADLPAGRGRTFHPRMPRRAADALFSRWQSALRRLL